MKNKTPELLKFKRLHRRLGFRFRRETIGLLEALWIFAQNNAKAGDVGRFTDEELAVELEWPGHPEELVAALVETGWLDRCAVHRLLVHDWADHSPNWLKGVVARGGGFPEPTQGEQPRVDDSGLATSTQGGQPRVDDSGLPTKVADPGLDTQGAQPPYPSNSFQNQTQPVLLPADQPPAAAGAAVGESSGPLCPVGADGQRWAFWTTAGRFGLAGWKLSEWIRAYPDLPVVDHLRHASQWLADHPEKRPHPDGLVAMLGSWLSQHATKALTGRPTPPGPPTTMDPVLDRSQKLAAMIEAARKHKLPPDWVEENIHQVERSNLDNERFAAEVRRRFKSAIQGRP